MNIVVLFLVALTAKPREEVGMQNQVNSTM